MRLRATDFRGPLGGLRRGGARFDPARVTLTSSDSQPLTVVPAAHGPVHSQTGIATDATLRASRVEATAELRPLAPGERVDLLLEVDGALPPGGYQSQLTLRDGNGRPLHTIPIELSVSVHWAWAMVFLVLGIFALGCVALLAGETEIRDELARVLELRREVHELIERYPQSPEGPLEPALVRRAHDALDDATSVLRHPRGLSLRDHRQPRAAALRQEAAQALGELRSTIAGRLPGQVAGELVENEWQRLAKRLPPTRSLSPSPAEIAATPEGFDRSLSRFLAAMWRRTIAIPVDAIELGLGQRTEAVALAVSAGEDERARRLAAATRRDLRRHARLLDRTVTDYSWWRLMAVEMSTLYGRLKSAAQSPELPAEARNTLRDRLSAAREAMAAEAPGASDLQAAHTQLLRASVHALEAESEAMLERLAAATEEATAATSLDAALSPLPSGSAQGTKRERLLAVVELLRRRIETVEGERRGAMLRVVEALEQEVSREEWAAAADTMGEVLSLWSDYQEAVVGAAQRAVLEPYCQEQARRLRESLAITKALAAPHLADPDFASADGGFERVQQRLDTLPGGERCLAELNVAEGALLDLSDRTWKAQIRDSELTTEKLAAIEGSGATATLAEARRLLVPVRPIEIVIRTPEDERSEGRRIAFEIQNLDPVWGAGTEILVDFGDGSEAWSGDAEIARQRPVLVHRYREPGPYRLRAEAKMAPAVDPGSDGSAAPHDDSLELPAGELVGAGEGSLQVAPDPISAARALADHLVNLRFALALAIGMLIQGWRLYGKRPFGARSSDYLEAFAVGFAAHAVVDGLAAQLPGLLG